MLTTRTYWRFPRDNRRSGFWYCVTGADLTSLQTLFWVYCCYSSVCVCERESVCSSEIEETRFRPDGWRRGDPLR